MKVKGSLLLCYDLAFETCCLLWLYSEVLPIWKLCPLIFHTEKLQKLLLEDVCGHLHVYGVDFLFFFLENQDCVVTQSFLGRLLLSSDYFYWHATSLYAHYWLIFNEIA